MRVEKSVHFCFGNYRGQTIQKGEWSALLKFLNGLHSDHLVLELAHRPDCGFWMLKRSVADRKIEAS